MKLNFSLDHDVVQGQLEKGHALSPWSAPFVALDVETTGLDTDPNARVVELAAVRFENGQPTARRVSTRINPGMPIPTEATAIHGITDADVVNAPTFAEAWLGVVELYDSDYVSTVAYSATFDHSFARAELERAGLPTPPLGLRRPWFDPLVWIRKADRFVKGTGRHKLSVTCARRGIVLEKAHAAEDDCIAAGLLWIHLERVVRGYVRTPCNHVTVLRTQGAFAEQQECEFQEYIAKKQAEKDRRAAELAAATERALAGGAVCTCPQLETCTESSPMGHSGGCPCFGTSIPHRLSVANEPPVEGAA